MFERDTLGAESRRLREAPGASPTRAVSPLWEPEGDAYASDQGLALRGLRESETGSAISVYNTSLRHALENLVPHDFNPPWREGKFTSDWVKRVDPNPGKYLDKETGTWKYHRWMMLEIRDDTKAYDAIKAIVDDPSRWTFDCASFVQAVHLYALAMSRGKARTNAFYAKTKLHLRFHRSPGLKTRKYFRRDAPGGKWLVSSGNTKQEVPLSSADVLRAAPFGSRVMWHNPKGENDWINENAVKVDPDRYRGFPLFNAQRVPGWKIKMGLAAHQIHKDRHDRLRPLLTAIKLATVDDVKQKAELKSAWRYTKANVYLREVQIIGPDANV